MLSSSPNDHEPVANKMTEEQEVFLKHIQKQGLKRTAQRDLMLDNSTYGERSAGSDRLPGALLTKMRFTL